MTCTHIESFISSIFCRKVVGWEAKHFRFIMSFLAKDIQRGHYEDNSIIIE